LRRGEWINNLGSQWSSFEFCVVIRSVGREKNKIIIFECALVKTENNQTGKNRNARMMRFFLLFYLKKNKNLQFKNHVKKRNFFRKILIMISNHARARARLFWSLRPLPLKSWMSNLFTKL
jgi:hypothetical protein